MKLQKLNKAISNMLNESIDKFIQLKELILDMNPVDGKNYPALLYPETVKVECNKIIPADKFNQDELCQVVEEVLREKGKLKDYPLTSHCLVEIVDGDIIIHCGTVAYVRGILEAPEDSKNGHLWVDLTISVKGFRAAPITSFK